MKRTTIVSSLIAGMVIAGSILPEVQPDLATRARAALNPRQMQIGLHSETNSAGNIH